MLPLLEVALLAAICMLVTLARRRDAITFDSDGGEITAWMVGIGILELIGFGIASAVTGDNFWVSVLLPVVVTGTLLPIAVAVVSGVVDKRHLKPAQKGFALVLELGVSSLILWIGYAISLFQPIDPTIDEGIRDALLASAGFVIVIGFIYLVTRQRILNFEPNISRLSRKHKVRRLIRALHYRRRRRDSIRAQAAEALGELGDRRAVRPLTRSLRDRDQYVCKRAARALKKLGWQPETLRDRVDFARGLERSDAEAIALFLSALTERNSAIRLSAARGLDQYGISDKRVIVPVIALLRDANARVRAAAASTLGRFKPAQAIGPLALLLNDSRRLVRRAAAKTLEAIGNDWSIDPFIRTIRDPAKPIPEKLAILTQMLDSITARTLIQSRLKDPDKVVREIAESMLHHGWTDSVVRDAMNVLQNLLQHIGPSIPLADLLKLSALYVVPAGTRDPSLAQNYDYGSVRVRELASAELRRRR